jgi:hypothetical protein
MDFQSGSYQNKKNGCIYYAEKLLTNAINDGQKMVEYYPSYNGIIDFDGGYVREIGQFLEKFDKINLD